MSTAHRSGTTETVQTIPIRTSSTHGTMVTNPTFQVRPISNVGTLGRTQTIPVQTVTRGTRVTYPFPTVSHSGNLATTNLALMNTVPVNSHTHDRNYAHRGNHPIEYTYPMNPQTASRSPYINRGTFSYPAPIYYPNSNSVNADTQTANSPNANSHNINLVDANLNTENGDRSREYLVDEREEILHMNADDVAFDLDLYEPHCNPNSGFVDICPNGEECRVDTLECKLDSFNQVEYCICPTTRQDIVYIEDIPSTQSINHVVHCDPHSTPVQQCPDGGPLCSPYILECHFSSPLRTHCNPNVEQYCPGQIRCSTETLQCVEDRFSNTMAYCICPSPPVDEVKTIDYCICPATSSLPEDFTYPAHHHHHPTEEDDFDYGYSCHNRCGDQDYLKFINNDMTNSRQIRRNYLASRKCGCDSVCGAFQDCCDDYIYYCQLSD